MNKIYIDWETFGIMIDELEAKIRGRSLDFNFDGVYGPARGGLPIAVALSHKLNLPLLTHPTENTLVVDDISDTGETLDGLNSKAIACLFSTDWTITKPTFFIRKKESKLDWIYFPWEWEY